jgi:3-hydroxyisobutyrate dehydrogenase-like beta-hydroxyacid dehydrogenase
MRIVMNVVQGKAVAFIGLGAIGSPLASHLLADGGKVTAYNRSPAKLDNWVKKHPDAAKASSAADAVKSADIVITCVGDDADLIDVYRGPKGILKELRSDTIVIDHTTASDELARALEDEIRERGGLFIDAPVSGGNIGAENRALSIMVGGTDEAFERAKPIISLYGRTISHIGPAGAGQLAKMVNQLCIAGILEGLAEGLGLAIQSGLDTDRLLEAMGGGAAGSWQMQNRSSYMLSEQFRAGFAARLMYKDLGLGISASSRKDLSTPVAEVVRARYAQLLERGLGDEDFSNLFRLVVNHL